MSKKKSQVIYLNTIINALLFLIPLFLFIILVKIKIGEFNVNVNNLEYEIKIANTIGYNVHIVPILSFYEQEYTLNIDSLVYYCEFKETILKENNIVCYYKSINKD